MDIVAGRYSSECCMKHPEAGAQEGAKYINAYIIPVTDKPSMILQGPKQMKSLTIKYWVSQETNKSSSTNKVIPFRL